MNCSNQSNKNWIDFLFHCNLKRGQGSIHWSTNPNSTEARSRASVELGLSGLISSSKFVIQWLAHGQYQSRTGGQGRKHWFSTCRLVLTNGPTNRRTDGWTDKASNRVARPRLKKRLVKSRRFLKNPCFSPTPNMPTLYISHIFATVYLS